MNTTYRYNTNALGKFQKIHILLSFLFVCSKGCFCSSVPCCCGTFLASLFCFAPHPPTFSLADKPKVRCFPFFCLPSEKNSPLSPLRTRILSIHIHTPTPGVACLSLCACAGACVCVSLRVCPFSNRLENAACCVVMRYLMWRAFFFLQQFTRPQRN